MEHDAVLPTDSSLYGSHDVDGRHQASGASLHTENDAGHTGDRRVSSQERGRDGQHVDDQNPVTGARTACIREHQEEQRQVS